MAKFYLSALIDHLNNRFPQARTLTLLGYFDPRNIHSVTVTPFIMLEIGDMFKIDGHKLLWVIDLS